MSTTPPADTAAAPAVAGPSVRAPSLAAMLVATIVVGLVSWQLMLKYQDAFPHIGLDSDMENRIRANPHDEIAWNKERDLRWEFYWYRGCLNYVFIGTGLGLAWGAVAGFAGRNLIVGILAGAILGAASAAGGAYLTGWVTLVTDNVGKLDEVRKVYDPLQRSFMMHGAAFASIGLGGGLIVALANRRLNGLFGLMVSGLFAGVLGTVIYEVAAAVFFQMERTDLPVPDGDMNKLAFAVLPGLTIAAGLWRHASVSRPSSVAQVSASDAPSQTPPPSAGAATV